MNQLFEWLANLFRGAKPWVIVLAWERGVRVRCGKHVKALDPGFHWRIPYLDEVRTINSRFRIAVFPCATISTKDGRVMTCAGNIGYRISDPFQAFMAMSTPDSILGAMGGSSVAGLISSLEYAEISVPAVEAQAKQALDEFVRGKGIEIEFVRMVDFAVTRVLRLLQEQWRPQSQGDAGH